MRAEYREFIASKEITTSPKAIEMPADSLSPVLFPFQRTLVSWALRKGRAALFADCGLGKTLMQLEFARHIPGNVLIIAPLAVSQQTIREALKINIEARLCRSQDEVSPGISVTNYEMVHHFDPGKFKGVVLDESSILKGIDGKTRELLTRMFQQTEYKLCCTATPAPNDIAEIANHAEFLGILTRAELLATFFVHDDKWRLKGHAAGAFYHWLASWSMSLNTPSDIGFPPNGYNLPELTIDPHFVATSYVPEGMLFPMGLHGIQDRARVRRNTLDERIGKAVELVRGSPGQWLVWCGLNDEGRKLHDELEGSVLIEGADSPENKADRLMAFVDGKTRILITKPRIAGFGMNFQNCNQMVFVGLSDSYEAYYHSIRRSWRFGQEHPVKAHIVLSDQEVAIYDNVLGKEKQAKHMTQELIGHVGDFEKLELGGDPRRNQDITARTEMGKHWTMAMGDCVEVLSELKDESMDMAVFPPPFLSLYTYTSSLRDIGNCKNDDEFWGHFEYVASHLLRVIKAGRICAVHVAQVPAQKVKDGYIGLKDFRGDMIRCFIDQGWIYHGEVTIDKNPQAQAVRTKAKGLLFIQLKKDSSWLRSGLADYIIVFRKPGDNQVPIKPDISNDTWIEWAHPVWYGIRETDTLSVAEARNEKDERHIAPLQLGTIERCIKLWSNPDELVLSPFAGIGSEGYKAIEMGRRFFGIELKESYFEQAVKNLRTAEAKSPRLF